MKFFIIFIFITCFQGNLLFSDSIKTHFNFILPLTYSQLHLQFPDNKLTDISTLDISMISSHHSPTFWPKRIPFAAGINNNYQNLFYYQFEPLGYSKLIDIPIMDPPIYDVSIIQDGSIFSITSSNFYTHYYDFKSKTMTHHSQPITKLPIKCVSNHKSKVAILFSNSLTLYRYRNNTVSPLLAISKKINTILADYTCLNMSINSKGYLLVISDTHLLFFSPQGILLNTLPNSNHYQFIDFTSYGDFILGSTKNTTLAKYTSNGFLLFQTSFMHPNDSLSDLVIYQPYGNLCLISKKSGAYYSMNTSLIIDQATYNITETKLSIDSKLTITFPALLTISILDANNNTIFLEQNKKMVAGNHHLSWKNLASTIQKETIFFNVKALYSNSNTVKTTFPLTKSL